MKPVYSKDKKKILAKLNETYGIKKLPYLILQFGKEKYRIYSGNLSNEEIHLLNRNLRIENMGLYFAKEHSGYEFRLTLDGLQILKDQITKNILELTKEQADEWFRGHDLMIESDSSFKVLKYEGEFIGCGKSTGELIKNFVPKERRIRN